MNSHHIFMFIKDLAIIMVIAGFITVVFQRFKQPIVLGYILAGIIIGPYTPPFILISDELTIKTLAELGIIFLMFSLGLEFNLHKLSKIGIAAGIAAFAEIILMMWLGYEIGRMFNWDNIDSLFLGAILAISSTTIIVKTLDELGMKKQHFSHLIFGILIIEDIFAILILTLLGGIALTGTVNTSDIVFNITKLASFLAVSLLLGILLVPKLLSYIAKFKNDEVLLISVLGLCFGFCLLVVSLDYSIALGAFIIGAVIAESKQMHKIEHLILPLRDMFSAIFFVSVGLLFDPSVVVAYWQPILVITLAVIIGKTLTCGFGVLITGQSGPTAMKTGLGLAQIGEFSFIIAALGVTLNVTADFLYPIAVAVSSITILLTPYLIKHSDKATRLVKYLVPNKIEESFEVYQTWLHSLHFTKHDPVMITVKRSLWQVLINLLIVIGIFLASAYIANTELGMKLTLLTSPEVQSALMWGIALVVSTPFLIAVYRKTKALSMLLAEVSVRESMAHRLTPHVRSIIAEMIPIITLICIMLFIFALSSSILPPIKLLILILFITAIMIVFILPWSIRFHSQLQINLLNTLNEDKKEEKKTIEK